MHPAILQQLAEAHVADLHRDAERRQAARTARRVRSQRHQSTVTEPRASALMRLRSLLTSRRPETASSQPADLTPELAQTAAGGPSSA
jgi:hypothetical protein